MADVLERKIDKLTALVERGFSAITNDLADLKTSLDNVDERLTNIETELASINRRLDALEENVSGMKGYAKELDELRARIQSIEKHLGLNRKIAA